MNNRYRATELLNSKVEALAGIGLDDLPDTALLAEFIDELEDMFEGDEPLQEINEAAEEFAKEFLAEEGFDEWEE